MPNLLQRVNKEISPGRPPGAENRPGSGQAAGKGGRGPRSVHAGQGCTNTPGLTVGLCLHRLRGEDRPHRLRRGGFERAPVRFHPAGRARSPGHRDGAPLGDAPRYIREIHGMVREELGRTTDIGAGELAAGIARGGAGPDRGADHTRHTSMPGTRGSRESRWQTGLEPAIFGSRRRRGRLFNVLSRRHGRYGDTRIRQWAEFQGQKNRPMGGFGSLNDR